MTDPKTAPETPEAPETPVAETVIEEADLLKSVQAIESKAKGEEPAAEPATPAEPKVKTAAVEKSLKDTIEDEGSEDLKKAIEVSPVLKEFADLVGLHVDGALKTLEKSLNGAAERDLAVVGALEALSKRIESFGDEPAAPAKDRPVTTKEQPLAKSADAPADPTEPEQPGNAIPREGLFSALESLVKSAGNDRALADRWTSAMVRLDSTGTLDPRDLAQVAGEYRRMTGAGA